MGELRVPMLMLANTWFVKQNLLIKYESLNTPLLRKLCTIHGREGNGTKFPKMEELKFPMLMLTNTWFVTQNLLVE